MAIFGTETIGPGFEETGANRKWVNRYLVSTAGSITCLKIHLQSSGKVGEQKIKGIVHNDVSGSPRALLGTSEEIIFKNTSAYGWYELKFAVPVKMTFKGHYWIGIITGGTGGIFEYRYAIVEKSQDRKENNYETGPTSPFGEPEVSSRLASLYAEYTPEKEPERPAYKKRAFLASSPFNQEIVPNPILNPNSSAMVGQLIKNAEEGKHNEVDPNGAYCDLYEFGNPVYEALAGTPEYKVTYEYEKEVYASNFKSGEKIKIPEGAEPSPGEDGAMIIIDTTTWWCYDMWKAKKVGEEWQCGYVAKYKFEGAATEGYGGSGSGIPWLAGIVRTWEIEEGKIEHALSIATYWASKEFKPPAFKSDGKKIGLPYIPEGTRVQLNPSINLSAIPEIRPAELTIGIALQKYGAYIKDVSGADIAFGFESAGPVREENPYYEKGLVYDYYGLKRIPWNELRVLEKNESEYKKEEKSVLGTVSNVRYYHQAAAWDSPLSFGVQAFIEYNGLVLNDRHQADLIRVTGISGLDDAEVRDSREPRPGESGEYAYDSFYGGRNLVINGFVEAGSLAALGTLSRNLKAAFAPLNESYLKFRWFDIYDPFDDPNTILEYKPNAKVGNESGNYVPLIGKLSNLKVENGLLSWKNAEKIYFIRSSEKRTFCDSQMTLKCIVGEKDSSYIGFILCAKGGENCIVAKYEENAGFPKLTITSVVGGEEHMLISEEITSSLRPVVGQPFWIRGRKEGNNIVCEFWMTLPSTISLPNFSVSTYLTGEDEESYGDGILSQVGIAGNQVNTNWAFDEFKIESIYPGDIQFKARKLNFSMKDEQTSLTKFKRPFQITMKSSDFRAFSSTQIYKTIYPSNISSGPALGRSYPRKYPLSYRLFTSNSLPVRSNLLSVNNRGSVYIEPILYFYGPGENILIQNLTNGQKLEWLGKVEEKDYIIIDCREKIIVNSFNSNFLEPLVPSSEWITIEPMWNDIYVEGSNFKEGITKFIIKLRYGYM